MRLVDDQCVVLCQGGVGLDLGQQNPVGHQLDQGLPGCAIGEAHLPTDRTTDRDVQFLGDALGDRTRGEPAWLGVPDDAPDPAAQLQTDFGDLGGLPGTGLPSDHHHLMVPDRRGDLAGVLADRQRLPVADLRHRSRPTGDAQLG